MQSLYLLGIVDISPRRGATVRALPIESVLDLALLAGVMDPNRPVADLFEFRNAVEGAIAELAATNGTEAQFEEIRGILSLNGTAVAEHDAIAGQRIDVLFHAAIAEASGNVVFLAVSRAMSGLLVELRRIIGGIPGAPEASYTEHQAIFAAIARRDGPAARLASQSHIESTRDRYDAASTRHHPDRQHHSTG
jgi:DNA-binding FadR family transcriptional regulator